MSVSTAIASWLSVVVAAAICAILLAISDTVPLAVAMTAMLTWHLMIGIGEAMITVAVVSFLWRTRPDLIYGSPTSLESLENLESKED
jgi:cobalt/nickel transport system permease protein